MSPSRTSWSSTATSTARRSCPVRPAQSWPRSSPLSGRRVRRPRHVAGRPSIGAAGGLSAQRRFRERRAAAGRGRSRRDGSSPRRRRLRSSPSRSLRPRTSVRSVSPPDGRAVTGCAGLLAVRLRRASGDRLRARVFSERASASPGASASDPGRGARACRVGDGLRLLLGLFGVDLPVDDVLLAERPDVVGHPVEEDGQRQERRPDDDTDREHVQHQLVHDRGLRVGRRGRGSAGPPSAGCDVGEDARRDHQRDHHDDHARSIEVPSGVQLAADPSSPRHRASHRTGWRELNDSTSAWSKK